MSRFRKIHMKMHGDERYQRLTPCQPCGQALWWHLIAGKQTGVIPGLFSIGEQAFAEQLRWPVESFREAFREVFREGMVEADWKAHFVFVFNALRYNPPSSPNVVVSWRDSWDELPECLLKVKSWNHFNIFLEGFGKGFGEAFKEVCRKPLAKALANQEQEQEQEQEKEKEKEPAAPEVIADPCGRGDILQINVAMVGDARGRGKRGNKMLTPPEFVRFWSAYPRKVAKAAAERCWRGINPDSALVAQIMSALEAHKKTPQWVDPVYVPHPATWLNQKRWEDELRPGGPRSLTDFDIAHGTYYPDGGPDGTGFVKETHHCSRETCTRCIEEKANGIVKPVQDLRGQYDY